MEMLVSQKLKMINLNVKVGNIFPRLMAVETYIKLTNQFNVLKFS